MRTRSIFPCLLVVATIGCTTSSPTPEQVRHEAAAATTTVVQDTKAAAEGIRDGVQSATSVDRGPEGHPVNINTSGKLTLMTLPGVTEALASHIITHRPYRSAADLQTRRVIPADVYDRIAPRIVAN